MMKITLLFLGKIAVCHRFYPLLTYKYVFWTFMTNYSPKTAKNYGINELLYYYAVTPDFFLLFY